MCLPAILVRGLNPPEQRVLQNTLHGRPFGVAVLNQFGGVPVIRQLQVLRLARQMPNDPQYGRARWALTECGQRAGQLLQDLIENPLLQQPVIDEYNRQILSCPFTRRSNPGWCQCRG
jgi:hypothetical protein